MKLGGAKQIDPTELYWGVIDPSRLPPLAFAVLRRRRVRERLAYLLEPVLPLPVDELHIEFAPLGNGSLLACGIERVRLEEIRDGGSSVAVPESLPEHLDLEAGVNPESLNLLTGEYEPPAAAASRRIRYSAALAVVALALVLVGVGLQRQASIYRRSIAAQRNETQALERQVLGDAPSAQPAATRLLSRVRLLRRTRDGHAVASGPRHAGASLQSLVSAWPEDAEARLTRASISSELMQVTMETDEPSETERLLRELRRVNGWDEAQSSVERLRGRGVAEGATRVLLLLEPEESSNTRSTP
ncbi:MAG: hypothetical protein AAGJ54_06895 [Planctomycetota bacterium]